MAQNQISAAQALSTRWVRTGLAVFAVVLVSACQSLPDNGRQSPDSPETSSALQTVRSTGGTRGVGDAALLKGKVIDKDGCLAIQHDEPDSNTVTIPVFDVEDERPDQFDIGHDVSLGGGVTSEQESFDIPEECSGGEGYFLVVME